MRRAFSKMCMIVRLPQRKGSYLTNCVSPTKSERIDANTKTYALDELVRGKRTNEAARRTAYVWWCALECPPLQTGVIQSDMAVYPIPVLHLYFNKIKTNSQNYTQKMFWSYVKRAALMRGYGYICMVYQSLNHLLFLSSAKISTARL